MDIMYNREWKIESQKNEKLSKLLVSAGKTTSVWIVLESSGDLAFIVLFYLKNPSILIVRFLKFS